MLVENTTIFDETFTKEAIDFLMKNQIEVQDLFIIKHDKTKIEGIGFSREQAFSSFIERVKKGIKVYEKNKKIRGVREQQNLDILKKILQEFEKING